MSSFWQKPNKDGKSNHIGKVHAILKGVTTEAFWIHINNIEENTKKVKNVKKFEIIERDEDGFPKIMYSLAKIPLMTDRENLCRLSKRDLGDGKTLFITQSIDLPQYPRTKASIRMDLFKASIFFQVGPDLELIEYHTFNMGGYVPAKLLNMTLGSMMQQGLSQFHKILKDIMVENKLENSTA